MRSPRRGNVRKNAYQATRSCTTAAPGTLRHWRGRWPPRAAERARLRSIELDEVDPRRRPLQADRVYAGILDEPWRLRRRVGGFLASFTGQDVFLFQGRPGSKTDETYFMASWRAWRVSARISAARWARSLCDIGAACRQRFACCAQTAEG